LTDDAPFPPVELALLTPNGLLAAGGELTTKRLLDAYRHGIFPWFNPGDPILWWSPDPRMVLFPADFRISRSLAKILRKGVHSVRIDTAFEQVMRACAAPRGNHHGGCDTLLAEPADCGSSSPAALPAPEGSASPCQGDTWIVEDMIAAYCALNKMGSAHSVEVWMENRLVGGVYGVSIGRMFYGESMFSRVSNASKIALAHLARQLERWQFGMIDCQMKTPHLATLGAREIPRGEFIARLQELVHCAPVTNWQFDADLFT
jgi:leucyl/phenylalanyl-tRNA--protein transferase